MSRSLRLATLPLGLAAFALLAPVAHADSLTSVDVTQEGEFVQLQLNGELGAPRVRSEAGRIRLWFSSIAETPRLDERFGEGTVRAMRLRPGIDETAVLTLELRNRREEIPSEEIMMANASDGFIIRIGEMPAAPIAQTETSEGEPTASAASAPTEIEEPEEAGAPLAGADADQRPSLAITNYDGPQLPYGLIGLISLLLLGAHFLFRYLGKQKAARIQAPEIDIVTSRRLGPRHQLMVVRALGEEHLISVHGNQTTLLATAAMSAALGADESGPHGIVGLVEREPTSKIALAMREAAPCRSKKRRKVPRDRGMEESEEELADRFGSKLLKLASKRREVRDEGNENPGRHERGDVPNDNSLPAPRRPRLNLDGNDAATSEAVAGLLRLRARAD